MNLLFFQLLVIYVLFSWNFWINVTIWPVTFQINLYVTTLFVPTDCTNHSGRWRICAPGGTNAAMGGAHMRHWLAHMRSQKSFFFFKKAKKNLKIWMDISIQFLRHTFLSTMNNNKFWFYQSSNFLGKRFLGAPTRMRICANGCAY